MKTKNKVIVIGGGAAGLIAACACAADGNKQVTVLERNGFMGKKLNITGKGRCNLTNDCTVEEAMNQIPQNSRFLYGAFSRFSPEETMRWFESLGVALKTERGGRVFPRSDRAKDITDALTARMRALGVRTVRERAKSILVENGAVCAVCTDNGTHECTSVILATGGLSYPLTGSTGDGYAMACALGHTVMPARPSLVALESGEECCAQMQGLALKNVSVRVLDQKGKPVYTDFGELLFTHFGLSGPVILSASAHMRDFDKNTYRIEIDLKPALDENTLDARLLRDFAQFANRDFSNSLSELLPRLMIPVMLKRSGIPPHTKVNSITKEQRLRLLTLLKHFEIPISGPRPIDEAIITSGGIKVSEINPSTMESKLIPGLYFAGEIIDVDGYTGGFNLQIAWSTGFTAGENAR